jgi:hypothetical protein
MSNEYCGRASPRAGRFFLNSVVNASGSKWSLTKINAFAAVEYKDLNEAHDPIG